MVIFPRALLAKNNYDLCCLFLQPLLLHQILSAVTHYMAIYLLDFSPDLMLGCSYYLMFLADLMFLVDLMFLAISYIFFLILNSTHSPLKLDDQ